MLLLSWALLWGWRLDLYVLLGVVPCLLPTPVLGVKGMTDATQEVLCSEILVTMATCNREKL